MRGRDGNCTLIFAICTLIFSAQLFGTDYYISYKSVIKNFKLYNEELLVSKAMIPCTGSFEEPIILPHKKNNTLKKTLIENFDEFQTYMFKYSLHVKNSEKTTNYNHKNQLTLVMPTKCFTVEFNDDFVRVTARK